VDTEQLAMIDEDLREHPSLVDIKDWSGLAKSYISGQKTIGEHGDKLKGAIFVPGEDASDIDKANFYGKLGRPNAATDYKFEPPENTPEWFKVPASFAEKFPAFAHSKGLSADHAQNMFDFYVENIVAENENDEAETAAAKAATGEALVKEWGKEFNNKAAQIDAAINRHFPGDLAERMLELATTDAGFANAFADLGKKMSEDTNANDRGDNGGGGGGGGSDDDALATIMKERATIMNDSEHAYRNKSDPGHRQAVDDMSALTTKMINLQNVANEKGNA